MTPSIELSKDVYNRYEEMRDELHPVPGKVVTDDEVIGWVLDNFRDWAEGKPSIVPAGGGERK